MKKLTVGSLFAGIGGIAVYNHPLLASRNDVKYVAPLTSEKHINGQAYLVDFTT